MRFVIVIGKYKPYRIKYCEMKAAVAVTVVGAAGAEGGLAIQSTKTEKIEKMINCVNRWLEKLTRAAALHVWLQFVLMEMAKANTEIKQGEIASTFSSYRKISLLTNNCRKTGSSRATFRIA